MSRSLPLANAAEADAALPTRVGVVSLGCPKNLVDTEVLLGRVAENHVICADPADADLVLVNTCGFIDQARDESLETIDEFARWRREGKLQGLVVTGCLAQRWGERLRTEHEGVDAVVGMAEYEQIGRVIGEVLSEGSQSEPQLEPQPWRTLIAEDPSFPVTAQTGRLRVTPPHYGYLQVSEGCSNACTFCSIPNFRGLFRSKSRADVLAEARELVEAGAVELNLISQDTTDWGRDLKEQGRDEGELADLLQEVAALDGLRWIRLLYAYPGHVSDRLIETLRDVPQVVPYIDMPIQHISTPVLKRMGRRHTEQETRELLTKLRERVPGLVLRTTFIVGFPGSTEEDFQRLLDFTEEFRFERLGVFPYSHEPNTPAGENFPDDVPEEEKLQRVDRLMTAQQSIAFAHAAGLVGQEVEVLVDVPDEDGLLVGRTAGDAPEIDPLAYLTLPEDASEDDLPAPGDLVQAKVVMARDYDVIAEIRRGAQRG